MIKATHKIALCLALVVAGISGPVRAASVGVSIQFDVAPIDLIRARGVSPDRIRICETHKTKIDTLWAGRKSSPTVNCRISAQMPLVVTASMLDGRTIARP